MEFEDVIDKLGGYGRFQRLLVWVYLAPASLLMPGYFMNQIFMLSVPKHSCVLPDLAVTFNLTDAPRAGYPSQVPGHGRRVQHVRPGLHQREPGAGYPLGGERS
ncbi:hypothetical protein MRX96_002697 [Rhipicephalus microplus]